ncbi:MAG TPA: methylenetetrahydrofolate reductase C-terminal domain-containing protein [Opitutaceae bacterium]|nr:methylenetetrahydrofolate reductase C-terminal domain-containing protein [Opitutaceae bacterium]
MQTLSEKLTQTSRFLLGSELVSVRGSMAERSAVKARDFANRLIECPDIDWISITDNAGGNPQLAPTALGKPILYAGKEVVIHLTCKDLNRNGLESEAWLLHSEGFRNILAMTGDYPVTGSGGTAKPVFDIDSVGLISMLHRMNQGFDPEARIKAQRLERTDFNIGAVTTNYKLKEGELMPQYFKLEQKVACGAHFIINQVGYDARKMHELRVYMDQHSMARTPLIGNVYVLNAKVAQLFHEKRVPGVVVSEKLLQLCQERGAAADAGKTFFYELAAKQIAIYRGLGYRGAYLGGVYNFAAIEKILAIERTFSPDDWKQFAREISFSRPGEYFFYEENSATGLANPNQRTESPKLPSKHVGFTYLLSKWVHDSMFTPGHALSRLGAKACANAKDPMQGPKPMRALEHLSKLALFNCKDCGDCSLPEIAFLCPESQCAKNQRNGPCGGTRDGRCEVDGFGDCIWLRAYERLKHDGREQGMLEHAPVVQNQALRGTSSWANTWLRRDHFAKRASAQAIKHDAESTHMTPPAPSAPSAPVEERGPANPV